MSTRTSALPPSIIVLVGLLALGWGSNWPLMKVVMTEMAPLHFRVLCLIAGAVGLFAIARANRLPIRVPRGQWPRLVAITAFNVAAWNVLAVYGVTFMDSGRAAILAYTFPVWGVLLGVWLLREPLTGRRLAGVVLGLLGMLLLLGEEVRAVGHSPTGALLLVASAICWAISTAIMKRWPVSLPTTSFTGWQMSLALLPITAGALVFEKGSFSPFGLSTLPLMGLIYNAFVSSIFCNWAWFRSRPRANQRFSLSTLMVPIVGVFSGMLVLGERPSGAISPRSFVVAAVAVVLMPQRGRQDCGPSGLCPQAGCLAGECLQCASSSAPKSRFRECSPPPGRRACSDRGSATPARAGRCIPLCEGAASVCLLTFAISIDRNRKVRIARRGEGQQALQQDLPWGGGEEVGAAHHVGDTLLEVVHHHRKLVGEVAVRAPHHEIAHFPAQMLLYPSLEQVVEGDHGVLHPHASCPRIASPRDAVSARARIDRLACDGERRVEDLPARARAADTAPALPGARGAAPYAASRRLWRTTSPSHSNPYASRVRRIASAAPGVSRCRSRSSIRTSHWPPRTRASRQLPTAATRDPKCSGPVGEGAKRPRYFPVQSCIIHVENHIRAGVASKRAFMNDRHHVVVVGGGAGGLELATRLGDRLGRRGQAVVTLVDQNETHL
jgi:drug/metabolite transporter (DMT)-like permease